MVVPVVTAVISRVSTSMPSTFSEPAAETPSDDDEAEAEPLPDGDTLKPGTFS